MVPRARVRPYGEPPLQDPQRNNRGRPGLEQDRAGFPRLHLQYTGIKTPSDAGVHNDVLR